MMTTLTDDVIRERGLVERYVAGKLSDAEASELETHYLTCVRCQADVRLAAAIRAAPVEPARRRVGLWAGTGIAAAAGVAALILLSPHAPSVALTRLGAIAEPPIYLGVAVRGSTARSDSVFEAAMASYGDRRYGAAVTGLDTALATGVDSAPAEFFRAASLLMMNRNVDAIAGFTRVITLGRSQYVPESHYYLAKVLIRSGRAGDALSQLDQVGTANAEIGRAAVALADSLRSLQR